jgi:hypothetical protein
MRRSLALIVFAGATLGVFGTPAFAAPSNAPTVVTGTADCGSAGGFSFVVNSGKTEQTLLTPAFVTAADGSTAVFVPTSLTLTAVFDGQTFTDSRSKQVQGDVQCAVSGSGEGFTFTGTVVGFIRASH